MVYDGLIVKLFEEIEWTLDFSNNLELDVRLIGLNSGAVADKRDVGAGKGYVFVGKFSLGVGRSIFDDALVVRVVPGSIVACANSCLLSIGSFGIKRWDENVEYSRDFESLRMGGVEFLM